MNDEEFEKRTLNKLFDEYWKEDPGHYHDRPDSEAIYQNLKEKLSFQPEKNRVIPLYLKSWITYAAASMILVTSVLLFVKNNTIQQTQEKNFLTTVSTGLERKLVSLPDGSKVELFENSSLRFNSSSDTTLQRSIKLKGKALFTVKHNALKPFKVEANNLLIEDIGTVFSVAMKNLNKDRQVLIKVKEGSIRVTDKLDLHHDLVMKKGDAINYINGHGMKIIRPADLNLQTIKFENASVTDIVNQLSFKYGIDINITGKPHTAKTYTGTFENERLKDVLDMIGFTLGFNHYTMNDDEIISYEKK